VRRRAAIAETLVEMGRAETARAGVPGGWGRAMRAERPKLAVRRAEEILGVAQVRLAWLWEGVPSVVARLRRRVVP
jgi:hypothetical protein